VRRRGVVVAVFAAVFVTGALLTAFGGTPGPRLVSERTLVLGQSGRIVSGHVGDVIDLLLGTGWNGGWRFACDSRKVQVVPVATVGMPVASPPSDGVPIRETAGAGVTYAALRVDAPGGAITPAPAAPGLGAVRMLRLTLLAPGVATLKGWHVQQGLPTQSVPDFVFILLVRS
jgi:hypothetical protein